MGGALASGSPHAGMEALGAATDAVAAGSARLALVVASDALRPGLGTGFEARCGAGAVALVLGADDLAATATVGARVTRTRPFLDRYRGDGEIEIRDLYDARLFREEIFLPVVGDVATALASFDVNAWSLPDPDGRLGSTIAKLVRAGSPASTAVYDAVGDTGAAAALLGAAFALDAAGTVGVVGTGGGRTTGVLLHVDGPVPGAARVASDLSGGRAASYPEALRARGQLEPTGETIPDGRAARERDVRTRRRRDARAARRPLRRLRHDQHATVDPSALHQLRRPEARAGGARARRPDTHLRREPHDARAVRRTAADRGARHGRRRASHAAGRRRRQATSRSAVGYELVLRKYAHERGVPVYGFKARAEKDDAA